MNCTNCGKEIPEGTKIFGYDIRGSWADDFEKFLIENEKDLPEGVAIDLTFEDLEKEASWKKIESEKDYSRIVAHYLLDELKDPEALIAKASQVLRKDGIFSVNGPDVSSWDLYFEKAMKEAGIDAPFMEDVISEQEGKRDDFFAMVSKYFSKVETIELHCSFRYVQAEDLLSKMKDLFPGQEKFFQKNAEKIKAYFEEKTGKEGGLIITTDSHFLHCSL